MGGKYYWTLDVCFFKRFYQSLSKLSLLLDMFCFSYEVVEFYTLYSGKTWPFYTMIDSILFLSTNALENWVISISYSLQPR